MGFSSSSFEDFYYNDVVENPQPTYKYKSFQSNTLPPWMRARGWAEMREAAAKADYWLENHRKWTTLPTTTDPTNLVTIPSTKETLGVSSSFL